MADPQIHSFAYVRGLPLATANLRPSGAVALAGCRVMGPINEKFTHRVNNEDIDEQGRLVGEYHDDLIREVTLTLSVPSAFTVPGLNTTIEIASATTLSNHLNGVWKIAEIGLGFKADDKIDVPLTLKKCANLTYVAAAAP